MNRRDFIRSASRSAAAAAIPAAGAAIAGGSELYQRLSGQIDRTAESLRAGLGAMAASLEGMSARVDYLELRYRLVLVLLVVSMLVDGGMTWMLFHAPVAVVA